MFGAKSFSRYRSVHFIAGLSDDLGSHSEEDIKNTAEGRGFTECVCCPAHAGCHPVYL